MGTSLTGVKIKDSYDSLLKVTDNGPLDGSLQVITDGLGNNSALSLSTAGASVGGTLAVSGAATLSSTLAVTGVSTLTGNLIVDTDTLVVDVTKESIGIGVAPFENSLSTSMDFEGGGGIFGYGNGVYFNGNLYYDSGWKLKATGAASNYLVDGNHIFYTTASGTAGDTVTTVQRAKIYNSGDISFRDSSANEAFYWDASAASLGIGTGTGTVDRKLVVQGAGDQFIKIKGSFANNSGLIFGDIDLDAESCAIRNDRQNNALWFATGGIGNEKMRIDSSGNVGIGTDSPTAIAGYTGLTIDNSNSGSLLDLKKSGADALRLLVLSTVDQRIIGTGNLSLYAGTSSNMVFNINSAERMRIDSSGNVGIGVSPSAYGSNMTALDFPQGVSLYAWNASAVPQMYLGANNYFDGSVFKYKITGQAASYYYQASGLHSWHTAASGTAGNTISFTERMRITSDGILVKYGDSSSARIIPQADGVGYLGEASARWDAVFAVTGTILTSDLNQKQDILDLEQAELNVATAIKGLIKKFRFKDAVESRGEDARIHVGVIAQDVKAAFEAEGLDASRYALFCSDTWWEKIEVSVDEEGNETQERKVFKEETEGAEEVTRLGIRYEELLAFVIAAI